MRVEVCRAHAGGAIRIMVELDEGATVGAALVASGILDGLAGERLSFGIFGRRAARDTVLRDGDRVEVYRPLLVDPKEARRRRIVKRQGPPKLTCSSG
jgi:putative ubiquitin-RnfH superfamily antitoxin RatB of RatAB toxin-antitoxin module